MRTRHLSWLVTVTILAVSTASAKRQPENIAELKQDARNAVGIIGNDKAKTQTYCQLLDLGRRLNKAIGDRDQKKVRAVSHEIDQLDKQLPEFVILSNVVKRVDLNSPDGQEITSIIRSLNQSCPE